jgi:hypothetical protein
MLPRMPTFACLFHALACLAACTHPATPTVDPGAFAVWSTADWGCVAPPFRLEGCGPEERDGEEPSACFVLTKPGAAPDWNPGSILGGTRYRLEGRPTGETMTLAEWFEAQGQPAPEGACDFDDPLPVYAVDAWCIEAEEADVRRRYDPIDDEVSPEYRAWLEETAERVNERSCARR